MLMDSSGVLRWIHPSGHLEMSILAGDIMAMAMTSTTTGVVLLTETISLCGASGGMLWDAHALAHDAIRRSPLLGVS